MARDTDAVLLESARVHRARLRAAFLHGDLGDRRTTNDNVRRFVGSVVVAAVVCASCAGWSFVQANLPSSTSSTSGTSGQTASNPSASEGGR